MHGRKIVSGLMGGTAIIFSSILAIAGFIFFGGIGYLLVKETQSYVWKGLGIFFIFCGLMILIYIFGTMYLTFTKQSSSD